MQEFTVTQGSVLKEDLYCRACNCWVYCPEMNEKHQNDLGETVECVANGCLKQDEKGVYLECPDCASKYYLQRDKGNE